MINVHVGVPPPPFHYFPDELLKASLLLCSVERPERLVGGSLTALVWHRHYPEQILKALVERIRVTFKIKEDVSGRRSGQGGEAFIRLTGC